MSEWISVKEKLPELDQAVLTWGDNEMHVSWREDRMHGQGIGWCYSYCCGCKCDNITHWQPLPEQPQDEGQE